MPADLITFLGRAEIWQSLKHGRTPRGGRPLHFGPGSTLQRWFDQQRARRDAGERLNGAAPGLVADWFHEQERQRGAPLDFGLCGD